MTNNELLELLIQYREKEFLPRGVARLLYDAINEDAPAVLQAIADEDRLTFTKLKRQVVNLSSVSAAFESALAKSSLRDPVVKTEYFSPTYKHVHPWPGKIKAEPEVEEE